MQVPVVMAGLPIALLCVVASGLRPLLVGTATNLGLRPLGPDQRLQPWSDSTSYPLTPVAHLPFATESP